MNKLEINRQLPPLPYANSSYLTPDTGKKLFSAAFPSLSFYSRMCNVIGKAGVKAKKGQYTGDDWIKSSLDIMRSMEKSGAIFRVSGLENVINYKDTPCVFVGNHMSTLETFTLPCLIQPHKEVTFVVKDSLIRYPFFGHVLKSRDPIVVSRKDLRADLAVMLEGSEERLKNGRSIIVFPQSSRSIQLDVHHFNSIGVKMAKRAGVPVVPVALRTDAWGAGRIVKDFGPIRPKIGIYFKFGEPMKVTGNGKAEHTAIFDFIKQNLTEWGVS